MAKEEDHILNIRVSYDKAVEGITKYRNEITRLSEREKQLEDDLKHGKITHEEYRKEVEINRVAQKNYRDEIRTLQKEIQNNIRYQQQQEGSLKQLRAELSNLTKRYDEMGRKERESAKGKELQQHIKDITKELKGAEEETDRFYRNVGNYKNSIAQAITGNSAFGQSLAGLVQQGGGIKGVMASATTSVKSFGAALWGLMANPAFLAIAGIAGAGVAFKWFYDYNQGIAEATRLTKEFTGLAGDELVSVRNEIQACADAMGHDFKDTLSTVDALMANYGISAQEATKIVEEGFAAGADLSGNMLAKIQQYAPTFHDAGISASEMVAIIQQTRSGIFSEKGLDTISMASKRIREMSSATRNALEGIGIDANKVTQDLQNGTRSTFDVIQEVSTKMKEFGANSQQVGTILQNVFGRGGADAGIKLIEQLDTMSTSLEEVKKQTGEWGEMQEAQIKATAELNGAMSALFDVTDNGWEGMIMQMKVVATQWLTAIVKGIIDVVNWFVRLYNKSLIVRAGVQGIVSGFRQMWSIVKLVFNLLIDGFKGVGRALNAFVDTTLAAFHAVVGAAQGFGKVLEGIADFSFTKIAEGVSQIKNSVVGGFRDTLSTLRTNLKAQGDEFFGDIRNFGKETFENYRDGFNAAFNGSPLQEITIQAGIAATGGETGALSPAGGGGGTTTGSGKNKATGGKSNKNNSGTSAEQLASDELAQVRKAEDLLAQLIEDSAERQRAILNAKYDRQIADLEKMLAEKGKHTATAEQAITVQIAALQEQRRRELNKLELQFTKQRVEQENKKYTLLIEAAAKGTREEYELQLAKLQNEQQVAQAEITASIQNEQQRQEMLLANDAAFDARRLALREKYLQAERAAKEKAIKEEFAAGIAGAEQGHDELGALQQKLEQRRALLEAANAAEYESEQAKNEAILQAQREFYSAQEELSKKRKDIEIANAEAIAQATQALAGVMEAFGNKNKTLTALSKVLALAQIAISSGAAIAKGIEQSQSVPYPANISAIATTVATILANIATAIKTVQGAKMATGGTVRGRGTGTSDQVPIQASNGESVMTAAATSMFAPALSAFNQLGGGVPIVVQSPAQQLGEEFLAAAFAKGMALAPRPVVAVEEINNVQDRVEVLERLGGI